MRRWIVFFLPLLLLALLTACVKTDMQQPPETDSPPPEEVVDPNTEDSTVTVSTAAELIRAIAPDAHIILKPGDYNFSTLTEEEIASCGGYVSQDSLAHGEITIYNAPGLTLEAEENGFVRLITENGYADVMTLTLCDGATLKGLILGHEIEKGDCDAYVLELSTSQSVTVEDCSLFGCGTYGIWAEGAAGLTVTSTEIYECTNGIFSLSDTTEAVFDRCRFHDNDGMFSLWEKTEVLIKDTEISGNRDGLLWDYSSGLDTDTIRITFQGCIFRDNRDMGAPEDYPCAVFEDCDLPSAPTPVSAGRVYDDLIQRYRALVTDPDAFPDASGAGEQNFLATARSMRDGWGYNPADMIGYAIEDLSGDGIPELAVGPTREYGVYLFALYTLVDGVPQLVFVDEGGSYAYLGDGFFDFYQYKSDTETGVGTFFLSYDGRTMICDNFYFSLNCDWGRDESEVEIYHNTTGSWNTAESELTDWTMEYLYAWEPEYEYLPMIPFSAN